MKKPFTNILPLIFALCFTLFACTGDDDPEGPTGPTGGDGPQGADGPSLAIHTVDVNPPIIVVSDTALATVDFSSSGTDEVAISWQASSGSIVGDSTIVQWIAPAEPGFHTLDVTVTAGSLSTTGRHTVQVIDQPVFTDGPFSVDITVENWDGTPMPEVGVSFFPGTPGYTDQDAPCHTGTWLPFQVYEHPVEVGLDVTIIIYDMENQVVRTLFDDFALEGIHQVFFDGRNDAGELLTGTQLLRYETRSFLPGGGYQQAAMGYNLTLYQPEAGNLGTPLGATDDQGMVSTQDKTLFPGLYWGSFYQSIVTEDGMVQGPLEISNTIKVILSRQGFIRTHELEIRPGGNHHKIVWGYDKSGNGKYDEPCEGGPVPMLADPSSFNQVAGQNYPNPFVAAWVEYSINEAKSTSTGPTRTGKHQ